MSIWVLMSFSFWVLLSVFIMVWRLAVADFGAQNCQYTTKVDTGQNVQLTTTPAIEPKAC